MLYEFLVSRNMLIVLRKPQFYSLNRLIQKLFQAVIINLEQLESSLSAITNPLENSWMVYSWSS